MHTHRWAKGRNASLIAVAIVLLMAMILWVVSVISDQGKSNLVVGTTVPNTIQNLIANPPDPNCVALATKYKLPTKNGKVILTYIPNEVDSNKTEARNDTDSVNISAIPAERDRISASICTQPEQAGMVGVAIATHYPQLVKFNQKLFKQFQTLNTQNPDTAIKEWADMVFSGKISYEDATMTMSQLAGLSTIFEVTIEHGLKTAWNYHAVTAITTKADVRPIVLNNKQYTGGFLVYRLTYKGLPGCWMQPFGFNIGVGGDITTGDQRIAGFTCETTPPPSVPPSTTPSCPPETPHGTWPVCKDSPNRDPEAQGHNRPGGGGLAPAQEDPVGPPAAGDPPVTYTPPPTPTPSAPPADSTPVPSPVPTPPSNEGGTGNTGDAGGF